MRSWWRILLHASLIRHVCEHSGGEIVLGDSEVFHYPILGFWHIDHEGLAAEIGGGIPEGSHSTVVVLCRRVSKEEHVLLNRAFEDVTEVSSLKVWIKGVA